jgi:hypothetical protein
MIDPTQTNSAHSAFRWGENGGGLWAGGAGAFYPGKANDREIRGDRQIVYRDKSAMTMD